jgi:hypothetical protein
MGVRACVCLQGSTVAAFLHLMPPWETPCLTKKNMDEKIVTLVGATVNSTGVKRHAGLEGLPHQFFHFFFSLFIVTLDD